MRVDYAKELPKAVEAMRELERAVRDCGIEPLLLELVKLRASQLNACASCLDVHGKAARRRGETEQRLDVLPAWRDTPFYSPRERAALAWSEALTLLPHSGAPDDVFADVDAHFSAQEAAALTFAAISINGWNRLAVGLRVPVEGYATSLRPPAVGHA